MRFALDYDGTADRDIELWLTFVKAAQARGHQVVIVTMRYPEERGDMNKDLLVAVNAVYFTGRLAKVAYMQATAQVDIQVWIDDSPTWLLYDAK